MKDLNIQRYLSQIVLPEIGLAGQQKIAEASVFVLGAGGLGSPILLYLAAAGVGHIGIADFDLVDISNLQRQILFNTSDLDKPKVIAAQQRLLNLNPEIEVTVYFEKISKDNILQIIDKYNIIIDASDNFTTKFLINDACVMKGKPFLIGGVFQWEGQFSVYNYNNGPSYRCLNSDFPVDTEYQNCAETGILGPVAGIIGSLMALETLKLIQNFKSSLSGKLLFYNGLSNLFQYFEIEKQIENFNIRELSELSAECVNYSLKINHLSSEEFFKISNENTDFLILNISETQHPLLNSYQVMNISPIEIISGNFEPGDARIIIIACELGIISPRYTYFMQELYHEIEFLNLKDGILGLEYAVKNK